jgi:hypothetical protein
MRREAEMWRAVIFCEVCSGESQGCFEGGSLTLEDTFPSKQAAETAAKAYIDDVDWWAFETYKP